MRRKEILNECIKNLNRSREAVLKELVSIQLQIKGINPETGQESSETDSDNAEGLLEVSINNLKVNQQTMRKQLDNIRNSLEFLKVSLRNPTANKKVEIGSIVKAKVANQLIYLLISGKESGKRIKTEKMTASLLFVETPIGKAIHGKKVGTYTYRPNGKKQEVEVLEIM